MIISTGYLHSVFCPETYVLEKCKAYFICFVPIFQILITTPIWQYSRIQNTLFSIFQVHALNVLRALYRDTRLGDDVFPYVAGGLRAAILGYGSQLWPVSTVVECCTVSKGDSLICHEVVTITHLIDTRLGILF